MFKGHEAGTILAYLRKKQESNVVGAYEQRKGGYKMMSAGEAGTENGGLLGPDKVYVFFSK